MQSDDAPANQLKTDSAVKEAQNRVLSTARDPFDVRQSRISRCAQNKVNSIGNLFIPCGEAIVRDSTKNGGAIIYGAPF